MVACGGHVTAVATTKMMLQWGDSIMNGNEMPSQKPSAHDIDA